MVKTHRSTQLFLYCPGGEHSVKCVCLALEMEASKESREVWLRVLRHAIKSKCPKMLSDGIILLHDNNCPYTANLVRDKLQQSVWETLQHPSYSPDLSPCDFHIFGNLQKDICGHWLHSNKEVKE